MSNNMIQYAFRKVEKINTKTQVCQVDFFLECTYTYTINMYQVYMHDASEYFCSLLTGVHYYCRLKVTLVD